MNPETTIRAELDKYLRDNDLTVSQFSKISGIHSGTLSRLVSGNRPIAMQQLERITSGMGLGAGALYDLYVDECFVHSTPNWRRLGPFLHRCADLNRLECIRKIVANLMDNLMYAQVLFETAEDFFNDDKYEAAAILYESVAESEKYQHSERLALCQYRLFKISLGYDQDANLRAAVYFEYFVERLDESDQLDALRDLANIYTSLHRWSNVDSLAKRMGEKAFIQYENKYDKNISRTEHKKPEKPLCFYILYSYLLRAAVSHENGDYEQAMRYAALYSDSSWIREDSEEAKWIMEQFKEWAVANTYLHRLMNGEVEILSEYVAYIKTRENEVLPAFIKIMQAANRIGFNADEVITQFQSHLMYKEHRSKLGKLSMQVMSDKYTNLLCELATYYLRTNRYKKSVYYILKSLELSVKINNDSCVIQCVGLFEEIRHLTTRENQEKYKKLISEVQRLNEKKNEYVAGCF
ncbi:helix-turn-helix domain-containing protein [Paenibacillus sp. GCM10012306]|uniref:helix-turn-helix domain-containing protein n=1 Tax=Paenibacillus sp. GCM10012306 TaxID=3317342 RepID=UPI00360CDAB0